MRTRAKIVATLGPASRAPERLEELIESGLAVVRVNMAHAVYDELAESVKDIRAVSERLGRPVAIMADLAGPKIRTGPLLEEQIELRPETEIVLTTDPTPGIAGRIGVTYPDFAADVAPGQSILISDGLLRLVVLKVSNHDVHCRVEIGGVLRENQGINLPETIIKTPTLTEEDREDLDFCLRCGVDIIAMSFVRGPDDILELKTLIRGAGATCPVIAKIENHEAIPNIDDIIDIADGVMIARGDLGVEVPTEEVPILQKQIIRRAQRFGKVSIVATQMLDSMIRSPRPTRAEASDVANSVFDGADAVMLSGETAIGKFPVEAVKVMSKIIERAEESVNYKKLLKARSGWAAETISGAISYATCHLASILPAAAIVISTESGRTARQVSRYRPEAPIIAVSNDEATVRQLSLWWGVTPMKTPVCATIDEVLKTGVRAAKESGMVKMGDKVVITAGALINVPGTTDLIKVERIQATL